MARTKWYIEVDSYWQNSVSVFIGPYADKQQAQDAADASGAVRYGNQAADLKHNVRYEIINQTAARKVGMNSGNVAIPQMTAVPNDTEELYRLKDFIYC